MSAGDCPLMRVALRVDASAAMGSGHLARCLTIAAGLRTAGAEVLFVTRPHPGHLLGRIEALGFACRLLSRPQGAADDPRDPYAAWRGVPETLDAEETAAALDSVGFIVPDWLVVDHYGLGRRWENALRPVVRRIFAIDDLERPHDCDLLLDQNYVGPVGESRYLGQVPGGCRRLLGPRYALLHPDFPASRQRRLPHDGAVRGVLVFFGGTDPTDETGKVLDVLTAAEFAHLVVEVVLGPNHPRPERVRAQSAARANVTLHESLPSLAAALSRVDIAFGAGGATTWERLCLGVPTLMTCIADNQRPAAVALHEAGVVTWIGDAGSVTAGDYAEALRSALGDPQRLREQSIAGRVLVDGEGCGRVISPMVSSIEESADAAATAG